MSQPKPGKSNYAKTFRDLAVSHSLQSTPQDREWLMLPPKGETQQRDIVLYLGCNVLRTTHMIRTVVDIFKMLDLDFVTVGGASYCCGSQHVQGGDVDSARAMAASTVKSFQKFSPERVVMWCPSCIYYYDDMMQYRETFPFQHVTEFLVENLDKLEFKQEVKAKVALHYHTGRPQSDAEAESAHQLLSKIPGLELVDVGTDPRFGRHCTTGVRSNLGEDTWDGMAVDYLQKAADAGVDIFSTLYHGCHRMMCGYEDQYPFKVEHYLTLVGRALGIEHEDVFKKHMLSGDVDAIMLETAPCATANGVSEEEARAAIQKSFGR